MRILTTINQLVYLGRQVHKLLAEAKPSDRRPRSVSDKARPTYPNQIERPSFFPSEKVLSEAKQFQNVLWIWAIHDDERGLIIGDDVFKLGYLPAYFQNIPYACLRLSDLTPEAIAHLRHVTGKCIAIEKRKYQTVKP